MINLNTHNCWVKAGPFELSQLVDYKVTPPRFTPEFQEAVVHHWYRVLGNPVTFRVEKRPDRGDAVMTLKWDWGITSPERFIRLTGVPVEYAEMASKYSVYGIFCNPENPDVVEKTTVEGMLRSRRAIGLRDHTPATSAP